MLKMYPKTTIFVAKKIVTMNPSNPEGTHVAVREGKILGVGTLDEVKGWGDYELDETFKEKVILPGFVEVHAHTWEGVTGLYPYQGYFDRTAPDGRILKGIPSIDALLENLRLLDSQLTDPNEAIVTMGFDPIYFPGFILNKTFLDSVSATRPIFILHANGHVATVNSAMLKKHNIAKDNPIEGLVKGDDGELTGELQEAPAMALVESVFMPFMKAVSSENSLCRFGDMARQVGVTTMGELAGAVLTMPATLPVWEKAVNEPKFPARICIYNWPTVPGSTANWGEVAQTIKNLQTEHSTDKLRFPGVKIVIDGSIQGWTAVMNWPGYYTGKDYGLLLTVPAQFKDWLMPFHKAGLNIQCHCNGDKAIDLFLETVEAMLIEVPWLDHRHTVQHCQLTNQAQFRKMKALGVCANIFTNHIWYWGDAHYELTVGPERANRMEPCGTAKRIGVPFSLHSDANVTPLGSLHLMWCAVNRVTPKGRVLGEHEKISAYDALWAVTQDAAYQMHMDHEIGSIECGKFADFAVLDESPLDIDPMKIKDIRVWGTVVGGVKYQATTV